MIKILISFHSNILCYDYQGTTTTYAKSLPPSQNNDNLNCIGHGCFFPHRETAPTHPMSLGDEESKGQNIILNLSPNKKGQKKKKKGQIILSAAVT